ESVMRHSWTVTDVLADWWFNIAASVEFWSWQLSPLLASGFRVTVCSAAAAAAFVVGLVFVARTAGERDREAFLTPSSTTWLVLAIGGFALITLSFPVYLLLDSARGLWRTQLLAGPGAGVLLCALPGLLLTRASFLSDPAKLTMYAAAGATISCGGSVAAIQKGEFHRVGWERHGEAIIPILDVAPNVKPDTVLILVNVPRSSDPFGHNMWFDLAARLMYPGTAVAAAYFYDDGAPSPGYNLKVENDRWMWDGSGFPSDVREAPIANTVVVDFMKRGPDALVSVLPRMICHGVCNTALYGPAARITGLVPLRVARRYRMQTSWTNRI